MAVRRVLGKIGLVLALLCAATAGAQGSRSSVATSACPGTEDPISESGSWDQVNDANSRLKTDTNVCQGSHGAQGIGRWVGAGSFNESQYSSVKVVTAVCTSENAWMGAIINASADDNANRDYFAYYMDENDAGGGGVSGESRTIFLVRVSNGSETTIDSDAHTISANDRIEVEYDADTDTLYGLINGSVISSGSAATLGAGKPGALISQQCSGGIDDFEMGNLTFGGSSNAPRAMHYKKLMTQ